MKSLFKQIYFVMMAVVATFGFVACNDNDDAKQSETQPVSLAGKWFIMEEDYKELLIVNADHSFLSSGADDEDIWNNVRGNIVLEGNKITMTSEDGEVSKGTFTVNGDKLELVLGDGNYTYDKLLEEFSMVGGWQYTRTIPFIKAIKEELELPIGSVVNGEVIPTTIKTSEIKGEFIEEALKAYFRNVEFKSNGELTYMVVKEGVETPMTKNYTLNKNLMTITGRVGSIDINNTFLTFQNPLKGESYLFLTKENVADMFVGYALMLREGNVSQGTKEALETFRANFLAAFENYAVVIVLQKK